MRDAQMSLDQSRVYVFMQDLTSKAPSVIRTYELASGSLASEVAYPVQRTLTVRFTAEDELLTTSMKIDNGKIAYLVGDTKLGASAEPRFFPIGHLSMSVDITADDREVAFLTGQNIELYELSSGQQIQSFPTQWSTVKFSFGGRTIYNSDDDPTAKLNSLGLALCPFGDKTCTPAKISVNGSIVFAKIDTASDTAALLSGPEKRQIDEIKNLSNGHLRLLSAQLSKKACALVLGFLDSSREQYVVRAYPTHVEGCN
jgi:hypothetical protein